MVDAPSAYELQRLKNVARNERVLEELGLGNGAASLQPKAVKNKKPKKKKLKVDVVEPSRASSRVKTCRVHQSYAGLDSAFLR